MMNSKPQRRRTAVYASGALVTLLALLWVMALAAGEGVAISGTVVDQDGAAVAGARVRVRATENMVLSGADGRFTLSGLAPGAEMEVTAWADGFYIASTHVTPPTADLLLALRPYHTQDHPTYVWAAPDEGANACGTCHPSIISQWQGNAHGTAVSNPRFYSLYNGTDLVGNTAVAPGYIQDFPGTAGNCADCHAPGAGLDRYLGVDMNDVRGQVTAGVHCDYCHKIGGLYLDPQSGSVYPNAPGVRSQRLLRPPPGDDIFFGPYDDVHDPDTYLPVISESQFCAPCHQFSFWGTPIYESYAEWQASAYAAAGVTCQACHMPPTGETFFALPEVGGVAHAPEDIPSHLQRGALDEELLADTVTMTLAAEQAGQTLGVAVGLTNSGAGHDAPTDHPGRQLLLEVRAQDGAGRPLTLLAGPRLPEWSGELAGQPGEAYAKVLADVTTGAAPVVSYWKPTRLVSDNRIAAQETSWTAYTFLLPPGATQVQVMAELRFRRLFAETAVAKGWNTPDIVMARAEVMAEVGPEWAWFAPLVVGRR